MDPVALDKPLKIDRRPLWVIVADRTWRYQAIAAVAIIAAVLLSLDPPAGLSPAGQRTLVLFGTCVFFWVTGLLPLAVTSLFAMAALPLLGIMTSRQTYALFGNEAVFFILGAFILAAAMTGSGLSSRLALAMLTRFGRTPLRLALSVFLMSALFSFAMSEHAVAAMMFAVVIEVARSLRLTKGSGYARLLFLSIGWGCVIGGIATFLGGARAPLAVGMLREGTGLDFGFFEWMIAALPIVLPLLLIGFVVLLVFCPRDIDSVEDGLKMLRHKRLERGRMTGSEKVVALVALATLAGWIFYGRTLGLANIAILAVVALFVFRVVNWQTIEEYVNWGVILMYGGAIALATALANTGTAAWLADKGLAGIQDQPFLLLAVFSLLAIVLTECISNAAVIAALMPIGLSLAQSTGIDPRVMTLVIALPAGLAFCLPMGTPANAIVFASGYLRMRDLLIPGLVIMPIAWGLFLLAARFVWPWLGLGI